MDRLNVENHYEAYAVLGNIDRKTVDVGRTCITEVVGNQILEVLGQRPCWRDYYPRIPN